MIRFEDRRETALLLGYEATDWTNRPDFEVYRSSLKGWTVRLMLKDKTPIGALYTKDVEFHVSVLPEWRGRWATRSVLNQIIQKPLSVTRVTPGFERVERMLERLGFEHLGDGYYLREDHGN